jgi:hypothetical protein
LVTSHVSHLVSRQAAVALAVALVAVAGGGVARGNEVTDLVAGLTRADAPLRPGCRAALARHTAAAWCDPARRSVARLRSSARKLRHVDATRAVRLAGPPLAVGQPVRVRARHTGRRAQLVLVVQDGDAVTYARFAGMGRGALIATAVSRAAPVGLRIRLRTPRRSLRPVVQLTAMPPVPRPPVPPPRPPPSPPPSRLIIQECGGVAPATADDVDEFNALWGPERAGPGWTGGDVTFSAPLPDGRTAWIFGDSFVGHVTQDGRRTGGLVHNSIVVQDGACLTTYANGTPSAPDALLRPAQPTDDWYWPADAIVEADHLHVLTWRVRSTGPDAWDFEITGTELATLALPALGEPEIRPLPAAPGVAWGSAVTEDGDRTYVYGIHVHADGERRLHVARTTTDLEGPWEYRTADGCPRTRKRRTTSWPASRTRSACCGRATSTS